MPGAGGFLTTHVLDTARGLPASGIEIDLFTLNNDVRNKIASAMTNADGRTDAPILSSEKFETGTFELLFHAGPYLRNFGVNLAEPIFLDEVPIRFGISDSASHYHVPLLLSPFGYSTYRGS